MNRLIVPAVLSALVVSGCSTVRESRLNPLGWFPGRSAPTTLAPEGGYVATSGDQRPGIPQVISAGWEPLNEGRLLVATGIAPTKGFFSAALVTAAPQPAGRVSPDADGVLRLRFVALPPPPDAPSARIPAHPDTDTITVAMALSSTQLAGVTRVEIAGGSNIVTLGIR